MKRRTQRKKPAAAARSAAAPTTPARRRVLLVDDHPIVRAGLAQLIDRQPDLAVAGEAGHPAEALRFLAQQSVDLLLTDVTMPERGGLELIKDLQALHPDLPVLVVSMHDEAIYAERLLRAGARGYIMKEAGGESLLQAIRQVLTGQIYVSPAMAATILSRLSDRKPRGSNSPIEKLSDREFEIFQLIGQGRSTREIATRLHLSPKTVDVHRLNIRHKLALPDGNALVRHAVRWIETQHVAE